MGKGEEKTQEQHFCSSIDRITSQKSDNALMKEKKIKIKKKSDARKYLDLNDLRNSLQLRDHIKSFPRQVSHYSREKNPKKRYLSENLNVKRMHHLYLAAHEPHVLEREQQIIKARQEQDEIPKRISPVISEFRYRMKAGKGYQTMRGDQKAAVASWQWFYSFYRVGWLFLRGRCGYDIF